MLKKYGGLGLETQSLGLGLRLDKKVLFTSLISNVIKVYARMVFWDIHYLEDVIEVKKSKIY